LKKVKPGAVEGAPELGSLVRASWDEFRCSNEHGMTVEKLYRWEDPVWEPPYLRFTIERHGGTVHGSSRADLHHWTLDVETGEAFCGTGGYRQLRPRQPALNVTPLANEIRRAIVEGREDKRLKWNKDGSVRLLIGEVIPESGPKKTVVGRRTRLRARLEELLCSSCWRRVRVNVYAPPEAEASGSLPPSPQ